MTEYELEKKAKEYSDTTEFTEYANSSLSESLDISEDIKQAYIAGAKEIQTEIEKLEQQIEKMKNCKNCEHYETVEDYGSCRAKCGKIIKGRWVPTNWKLYKDE